MRAQSLDQGRDRAGRPAAQARRRAGDRARLVRQPGRRCRHRRAAVVGGVRDRRSGEAEGQGGDLHRRRIGRHHRRQVRTEPSALGLRHLVDAARRGRCGGEGGRRQLVLHHRRLRVRPFAAEGRRELRHRRQRQGARRGAGAVSRHDRLLLVPGAGEGQRRQGDRAGQRRQRHGELHQAGGGVRHHEGRPEGRRPDLPDPRRARRRPGVGAGRAADRAVLLEPERRHARIRQTLCGALQRRGAGLGARRPVFGGDALSEGRAPRSAPTRPRPADARRSSR